MRKRDRKRRMREGEWGEGKRRGEMKERDWRRGGGGGGGGTEKGSTEGYEETMRRRRVRKRRQ